MLLLVLTREKSHELLLGLVLLLVEILLLFLVQFLLLVILRGSLADHLLILAHWLLVVELILIAHDFETKALIHLNLLNLLRSILLSLDIAQDLESVGKVILIMHD